MAKDIAIIQVCFNLLDPYQQRLHERVAGFPNRSGYVKRLIQWDMEREGVATQSPQAASVAVVGDFQPEGFI